MMGIKKSVVIGPKVCSHSILKITSTPTIGRRYRGMVNVVF